MEDNALNAEIAETILEELGFTVETVTDGDEAVQTLRASRPGDFDVVLMDIMMPRMNGLEATRLIRATDGRPDLKTLPILAMSANAFDDDVKKSMESGMNGHLSKPIEIEKLTAALCHRRDCLPKSKRYRMGHRTPISLGWRKSRLDGYRRDS